MMKVTHEDLVFMTNLIRLIADPAGDGTIYHEVRLSPENTKEVRDVWDRIKNNPL